MLHTEPQQWTLVFPKLQISLIEHLNNFHWSEIFAQGMRLMWSNNKGYQAFLACLILHLVGAVCNIASHIGFGVRPEHCRGWFIPKSTINLQRAHIYMTRARECVFQDGWSDSVCVCCLPIGIRILVFVLPLSIAMEYLAQFSNNERSLIECTS